MRICGYSAGRAERPPPLTKGGMRGICLGLLHVYPPYPPLLKGGIDIWKVSTKQVEFRSKQFCHLICYGEQTKEPTGMKKDNPWAKAFWILLQF